MTTFWREGFWRTNSYDTMHWVEGHWVNRDDWDRASGGSVRSNGGVAGLRQALTTVGAGHSVTACYVDPNAECPDCGNPVFFYQNRHGSRVYFDELGPPWPKHPCADRSEARQPSKNPPTTAIVPTLRDPTLARLIERTLPRAELDPEYEFGEKYGTGPWSAWQIDGRFRSASHTLLILCRVDGGKPQRLFIACRRLPLCATLGTLVFFYRGWLAYFDLIAMRSIELQVQRLRTAKAFVDALVQQKSAIATAKR